MPEVAYALQIRDSAPFNLTSFALSLLLVFRSALRCRRWRCVHMRCVCAALPTSCTLPLACKCWRLPSRMRPRPTDWLAACCACLQDECVVLSLAGCSQELGHDGDARQASTGACAGRQECCLLLRLWPVHPGTCCPARDGSFDCRDSWASCRDLARQALTYLPAQEGPLLDVICRWTIAFSRSLMCHLRCDVDPEAELR